MTKAIRASARGKGASVCQKSTRTTNGKPQSRRAYKKAKPRKRKGGPAPGTPSPTRTRMSPELQAHVRRLYEETDQPVCQIALDCGVNESVIRRMGPREGWVRFEAPPRDLPPVAKLLAQVEELERDRHPEVRAISALSASSTRYGRASKEDGHGNPPSFEGGLRPPPQDDGEGKGATREDNIARFTQVVMAHLDEFEAMRRDGRLLPKHHLATARAISILTEAFNRLARLRAALPGTIHDDLAATDRYAVLPADLDAFREELAQRIETVLASRTDAGAFIDAAAASAAATE